MAGDETKRTAGDDDPEPTPPWSEPQPDSNPFPGDAGSTPDLGIEEWDRNPDDWDRGAGHGDA
jgi:hypothetical protein